jgi:hypothetical protein
MMMRVLVVARRSDEAPEHQRERADEANLYADVERQAQAQVIGERRERKGEEYADNEPHLFQVRTVDVIGPNRFNRHVLLFTSGPRIAHAGKSGEGVASAGRA